MTLTDITDLCKKYADDRDRLAAVSDEIRTMRRQAVRSRLRGLISRIAEVSSSKDALQAAIESSPELFLKPRTRAIEGIKVGYRKMPGKIDCDEARTIARVKSLLSAEQQAALIKQSEKLILPALKVLDSKTLAKVGVSILAVDDEVVIKAASTDLDKLVDTLLADGGEEVTA